MNDPCKGCSFVVVVVVVVVVAIAWPCVDAIEGC